jgi:hypothetical protein
MERLQRRERLTSSCSCLSDEACLLEQKLGESGMDENVFSVGVVRD